MKQMFNPAIYHGEMLTDLRDCLLCLANAVTHADNLFVPVRPFQP
jgi:hypothetical protein